ncbi:TetR/AcrR family transcriptional regulator [Streptomyces sp. NPDC004284]|uniref:TetR/AcrR family transcriptional regulator n=1 Tax=Streptomyces sp. NPDC004284 TaxID=3364695 RepID=UPI0036C08A18
MDTPGLRERNKARRREAITRAAFRLFAERGYAATTIADIAAEAEVSPRTVTLYFATKQDLALSRTAQSLTRLTTALRERPAGVSTLDEVADWLGREITEADELGVLEQRMFDANPELAALRGIHYTEAVNEGTAALARDMSVAADDTRPRLAAAATVAVIVEAYKTPAGEARDQALRSAFAFLTAGITRLSEPAGS